MDNNFENGEKRIPENEGDILQNADNAGASASQQAAENTDAATDDRMMQEETAQDASYANYSSGNSDGAWDMNAQSDASMNGGVYDGADDAQRPSRETPTYGYNQGQPQQGQYYGQPGYSGDYPENSAARPAKAKKPAKEKKPAKQPGEKGNAKKIIIICAAAVVLVVLIVIGAVLISGMAGSSDSEKTEAAKPAYGDRGIYFINDKGGYIEMIDEVAQAYKTPDGKNIVVIDEDGDMYLANRKGEKTKDIKDDCSNIEGITDNGIVFEEDDGDLYRYMFSGNESERIIKSGSDDIEDYIVSGTTYAYATDDREIIINTRKGKEKSIGTYVNEIEFKYLAQDGSFVLWSEYKNSDVYGEYSYLAYYFSDGKKITELGTHRNVASDASFDITFFNNNKDFIAVFGAEGESTVYLCKGRKSIYTFEFKESVTSFCTNLGSKLYLSANYDADKMPKADIFYIACYSAGDNAYDVYALSFNKEAVKVLDGVDEWLVNGDYMFYRMDDDLYRAKLKKTEVGEGEHISSDVENMTCFGDAFIIYNVDDGIYAYSDKNEAVAVLEDNKWQDVKYADNEKEIFYTYYDSDSEEYVLMRYNVIRNKSEEIMRNRDIIGIYINSDTDYSIKADSLWIRVYAYEDNACDLYFYNGKKTEKVLEGVR